MLSKEREYVMTREIRSIPPKVSILHRILLSRKSIGFESILFVIVTGLTAVPASAEVFAEFGGPLYGLATAPNGDLLLADAGSGVIPIRRGELRSTIVLPGITDVSPIGRGSMWAVTGAPSPDTTGVDSGQGLHRISAGESTKVGNLFQFEAANNPDGLAVDSNPFDVQSLGGKFALVADAGANDLLRVDNQGHVTVLAVFPNELVSTANIKELAQCPSPAPFCGLPPFIPAQPVPTSIAVGPEGYIYVGELKGFPAPTGESNIWRVSPNAIGAQCGASADCEKVFDGGFTSIIDMAFGDDGQLYVAEMDEASWAAVEIFGNPTGGTINACDISSATCSEVATGISELTAITFGTDGSLWATRNSLVPGSAEVVQVLSGSVMGVAIPEPGSAFMLLAGLVTGFCFFRRARARN
jgi:hypothetical protein